MRSKVFLAGMALAAYSSVACAATKTVTCIGEFGSGSGTAGSYIGDHCLVAADTDQERLIQATCEQGAQCSVRAIVIQIARGRYEIKRVLSVSQNSSAPSQQQSYLEDVAEHLDGILAPATGGCKNPKDTSIDRVSVLLAGLQGPAVQLHEKYCAITNGSGDKPSDGDWQAKIRGNCGSTDIPDNDLRSGRAGVKSEIVIQKIGEQIKIDGEPLIRCPVNRQYTPSWWVKEDPSFRGKLPGE